MDVELQILKHLPRSPQTTISVVDEYCESYKDMFCEVRSYEYFKYLHIGIISPIKRKSFPEIAKAVGINCPQSLHHFIANSPWSVEELRGRRIRKTLEALQGEKIAVIIDETGDRKKGKKTDYVARQYLGSVGKVDRGIVSVNAYGVYENITFPLLCKVFKPKGRLKKGDVEKTKIEIAIEIIKELIDYGFKIELVLADSLYGEAGDFIQVLEEKNLWYIVSIRKNHGVWMPSSERVRANKWYKFERVFSDEKSEERWIREIIFGRRRKRTYWQMTTDTKRLPENSTSWVMTNLQETRNQMKKTLGNLYGLRTWVEYGFRQCKQELGWTDYRLTQFDKIEKWWEMILSSYLMISLNSQPFLKLKYPKSEQKECCQAEVDCSSHQQWNHSGGWKNVLNNFRLLIQPTLLLSSIIPWLSIFPNSHILRGLNKLISHVNQFQSFYPSG
ncbi:IS701 family transposase [Roseofilum casamattae]|uniref:IS701 family transposase n=1 Tax=Roseofilum casamattae BLCC-M143 TaxID=3022442 RepID=A0ABT7BYK6_9CYAN|nr:IS701 family transposase [Roseofilum casamattae]MDJ1184289.1 IS701 family transposase [Roseofilum casamattae BLCC-M143]